MGKEKKIVVLFRQNGHKEFERRVEFAIKNGYKDDRKLREVILETMAQDKWVVQMFKTSQTQEEIIKHKESLGYKIQDVREIISEGKPSLYDKIRNFVKSLFKYVRRY